MYSAGQDTQSGPWEAAGRGDWGTKVRILPRLLVVVMLALGLASSQLASAASISDYDIQRTWNRTDKPMAEHQVSRTWM
jgi:hypothetical protein